MMKPMRGRSLASMLALVILAIIIHVTALSGFWLYDDPVLLVEAISQPARAILFDPAEYSHLSATTFTPLLLLSFKLDLLLHGLTPKVFYAHQIVAVIIAALLLYLLLRRYVPEIYATAGAAVFLTTWETVYAARTLMIRHYLEGLVFALAALLAWRRSRILAAVFYLLAMVSKEVYAPLPLFFICQSWHEGRSWREIARELVPPATAAIIFLLWRWFMTGLTGTYAAIGPAPHFSALPRALWAHLVGPGPLWPGVIWGVCIAVGLALFVWRYRLGALAFLALSLIALLLPLLPLTSNFEWRYSFAFVAFGVGILTLAVGMSGTRWAIAVLAIVLLTTVTTSIIGRRYYENLTRNGIEQEGRYIWTQPKSAPALAATSPAWYLDGLAWLRRHENRGESPQAVFSRYAITVGMIDPSRMVTVDRGRIVPISSTSLFGMPSDWQRTRMQYDGAAPLSIEFALRDHQAQWRLGPPAAHFIFLTDPGYTAIPIPPSGNHRVPRARERQFFRIVREEENGRWTVSPTLPVPYEGAVTVWRRPLRMKVFLDRNADHFLEALAVRLDRSRRLVEKDALHAKERHEHGDQIKIRLLAVGDLTQPVFK